MLASRFFYTTEKGVCETQPHQGSLICWFQRFQVEQVKGLRKKIEIYWDRFISQTIQKLLNYHHSFCQGNFSNHFFLLVLLLRGDKTWGVRRFCWIFPKRPSWGSLRLHGSQKCLWRRCRPCTCTHKGWSPEMLHLEWATIEFYLAQPDHVCLSVYFLRH